MRIAALAVALVLTAPTFVYAQTPSSPYPKAKVSAPDTGKHHTRRTVKQKTRGRVYDSAGGSVTATPASHENAVSSRVTQAPETVFVKGNVIGMTPCPHNCVITGSKTSLKADTIFPPPANPDMDMDRSSAASGVTMQEPSGRSDVQKTAGKAGKDVSKATKKAGKDISKEAKRTPKNLGKAARKVGHGVKEAASDVKKAVTRKP